MSDIKRASTIELKNELERRGYKVTFYRRPDGAIRISSINGQHYKLSEGNKAARSITGKYLSRKQITQRRKASPYAYTPKLPKLTKSEQLFIRRYNRKVKKLGTGIKVKMKTARIEKRKYGFKGLKQKLFTSSFRQMGIARISDVEFFQEKLRLSGYFDAAKAIEKSITYKGKGHASIMDASLVKEMDYWYDLKNYNGSDGKSEEELIDLINEDYKTDRGDIDDIYAMDKSIFVKKKQSKRKAGKKIIESYIDFYAEDISK